MLEDKVLSKVYLCRKKKRSNKGSCITWKMDLKDDSLFENLSNEIDNNSARNEVGSRIHIEREGAGAESFHL